MRVSLIVAMTRRGVIGRGGTLPWRLSADLKRFKSLTMGHHLIMGRKTFESLGRPLPGRTSIIVTRQTDYRPAAGVLVARSLVEALELAQAAGDEEAFIIGGGEVYSQALGQAERLYVTWVEADLSGDTFFPAWNPADWNLVQSERHAPDARNEYDTTFCVYCRNGLRADDRPDSRELRHFPHRIPQLHVE